MRYGSVCSGVAPQTSDWTAMGLECAWFSEIEPFPSAVLAYRHPEVPNLGDFTQIGTEHGSIDLLVGGTPCQSFSVAGKRAGLDDARGNLTIEFARLAQRLRPRWLAWENVPGVLSIDGGVTFGTFLRILGQLGYGFAYRVLDAQYFGVAQRRRRVFVVGCLGDWRRAAAVLFERESLSGHPPPRRETGKGTSHQLAPCLEASGRGVERAGESRGQDPVVAFRFQRTDRFVEDDKVGSLAARDFKDGRDLITHSLSASHGCTEDGTGRGTPLVTHSLSADGFDASEDGTGRGTSIVPTLVSEGDAHSGFRDENGLVVAFAENQRGEIRTSDISPQLSCAGGKPGSGYSAIAIKTANTKSNGSNISDEGIAYTLDSVQPQAVAFDCNYGEAGDVNATLRGTQRGIGGGVSALHSGMAVRRLTPRECERLQGFSPDYTLVPYNGKPASDGPRYKAIGNSWAVPVLNWIAKRIIEVERLTCSNRQ